MGRNGVVEIRVAESGDSHMGIFIMQTTKGFFIVETGNFATFRAHSRQPFSKKRAAQEYVDSLSCPTSKLPSLAHYPLYAYQNGSPKPQEAVLVRDHRHDKLVKAKDVPRNANWLGEGNNFYQCWRGDTMQQVLEQLERMPLPEITPPLRA